MATSTEEEINAQPTRRTTTTTRCQEAGVSVKCIEKRIEGLLRTVSTIDTLNITDSVQIVKKREIESADNANSSNNNTNNNDTSLVDEIHRYARSHVMNIKLSRNFLAPKESRTFFGGK